MTPRRLLVIALVGLITWIAVGVSGVVDADDPTGMEAAIALAVAVRGDAVQITPPPTPPATGPCAEWVPLLIEMSPGWDVAHMQRICYRESRGLPGVTSPTGCCRGLFQVHRLWVTQVAHCGVTSATDLYDPVMNVCAAAYIFQTQGMGAWSQTR